MATEQRPAKKHSMNAAIPTLPFHMSANHIFTQRHHNQKCWPQNQKKHHTKLVKASSVDPPSAKQHLPDTYLQHKEKQKAELSHSRGKAPTQRNAGVLQALIFLLFEESPSRARLVAPSGRPKADRAFLQSCPRTRICQPKTSPTWHAPLVTTTKGKCVCPCMSANQRVLQKWQVSANISHLAFSTWPSSPESTKNSELLRDRFGSC